MKNFIVNITNQINSISNIYTDNLNRFNEVNNKIKEQAKDYYEKYKTMKRQFLTDRRELKAKTQQLQSDSKENLEDNDRINSMLGDVKNELAFFKNKIGIKEENADEEIQIMADILDSVKDEVDIYEGLNNEEINYINMILGKYKAEDKDSPIVLDEPEEEPQQEEERNDEDIIIAKLEEVVNKYFTEKKIPEISIDQVDTYSYTFNDKNAVLFVEGDVLKVNMNNGSIRFDEWILNNFGLNKSNGVNKKGNYYLNLAKVDPIQAMIDKKLGEKKSSISSAKKTILKK